MFLFRFVALNAVLHVKICIWIVGIPLNKSVIIAAKINGN